MDPTGAQIGEEIRGEEGIVYGDLDLNACVEPKQFHDVVGNGYQRYDIFDLKVDRRRQGPETAFEEDAILGDSDTNTVGDADPGTRGNVASRVR